MKSRLIKSIVLIVFGSILLMNIQVLTQGTTFPVNFTREAVAQGDEDPPCNPEEFLPHYWIKGRTCWDFDIEFDMVKVGPVWLPHIDVSLNTDKHRQDCKEVAQDVCCKMKDQHECQLTGGAE